MITRSKDQLEADLKIEERVHNFKISYNVTTSPSIINSSIDTTLSLKLSFASVRCTLTL